MDNNFNDVKIISKETPYTPEQAGYDASRIAVLDKCYQKLVTDKKLQCGAYIMSLDGKVFAQKSFGKRDFRDDKTVLCQPDDMFRIASITKTFTAIAIMKLVEDGEIYLSQQVSAIIDEFDTDEHRWIMIHHLLTHTSGINHEMFYKPSEYTESYDDRAKRLNNWIKIGLSFPRGTAPGAEWSYSSFGYMVLGEIIHRVTGMKAEEYIDENIIKPLGLSQTSFTLNENQWDKLIIRSEWDIPNNRKRDVYIPSTAGGLYSNLNDLMTYGIMLLNKGSLNGVRILSPGTVENMTYPHLENCKNYCYGGNEQDMKYGLGFVVEYKRVYSNNGISIGSFGHEGAGRYTLKIDPVKRLVVVYSGVTQTDWVPESVFPVQNIMWSGLK